MATLLDRVKNIKKMKAEEEKDFITHIDNGKKPMEDYFDRQFKMGTIAVVAETSFGSVTNFDDTISNELIKINTNKKVLKIWLISINYIFLNSPNLLSMRLYFDLKNKSK